MGSERFCLVFVFVSYSFSLTSADGQDYSFLKMNNQSENLGKRFKVKKGIFHLLAILCTMYFRDADILVSLPQKGARMLMQEFILRSDSKEQK